MNSMEMIAAFALGWFSALSSAVVVGLLVLKAKNPDLSVLPGFRSGSASTVLSDGPQAYIDSDEYAGPDPERILREQNDRFVKQFAEDLFEKRKQAA